MSWSPSGRSTKRARCNSLSEWVAQALSEIRLTTAATAWLILHIPMIHCTAIRTANFIEGQAVACNESFFSTRAVQSEECTQA